MVDIKLLKDIKEDKNQTISYIIYPYPMTVEKISDNLEENKVIKQEDKTEDFNAFIIDKIYLLDIESTRVKHFNYADSYYLMEDGEDLENEDNANITRTKNIEKEKELGMKIYL